ncbi:MAG: hypothetical protein AB1390_04065 [Nitrospirota bacterium]
MTSRKFVLSVSLALTLLLLIGVVHAGPIPDEKTLSILPAPIMGDLPLQLPSELPPASEEFEFSFDVIQHASGPLHATMLDLTSTEWIVEPEPYTDSEEFMVDSTVIGTVNMTNDSYQDTEPAVIGITIGNTDYITTAYIKFPTDRFRIYTATTTDYFNTINHRLIYIPPA